jgi:hypothetical protein
MVKLRSRRYLLWLLLAQASFGQTATVNPFDPHATFTQQELRSDFVDLRKVLEESHPGLYRYSSKAEMDRQFDRGIRSIDGDKTIIEFYEIVTKVLSEIRDGHTNAYLPSDYRQYLKTDARLVPLQVTAINGQLYVLTSAKGVVPSGALIQSIDGRSAQAVVDKILSHLSGDGDILTGKFAALDRNFPLYYYLFVEQPETITIRYRYGAGGSHRVILSALRATDFQTTLQGPVHAVTPGADEPLRYELLRVPHAARLTIETFSPSDIQKAGQDFSLFLASAFSKAKDDGIEDLLIDLRGNDGGDDYGPLLFSYLATHPFKFFDRAEAVSSTFTTLREYSHLGADFQHELIDFLVPNDDGRFLLKNGSGIAAPDLPLQETRYGGRAWFLVDGDVFSATAEFCSVAFSNRRGKFLGVETGGAYHGNSSGESVVITLPHSKLRAAIPLVMFSMAESDPTNERRGVIPEYSIQPTIQQLLIDSDPTLDRAIAIIGTARSESPKETLGRK